MGNLFRVKELREKYTLPYNYVRLDLKIDKYIRIHQPGPEKHYS